MSTLQIEMLVYGTIALLYLAPTYIEGERTGGQWSPHRVAGLVFCFFWPLLTVVLICKAASANSKPTFVFVDHPAPIRRNSARRTRD